MTHTHTHACTQACTHTRRHAPLPTHPMVSFLMFLLTISPFASSEIPSSEIWHLRRFSSSRFGRELDRKGQWEGQWEGQRGATNDTLLES